MDKMHSSDYGIHDEYGEELTAIAADLREAIDEGDDEAIAMALKQAISHCLDDQGLTVSVTKG